MYSRSYIDLQSVRNWCTDSYIFLYTKGKRIKLTILILYCRRAEESYRHSTILYVYWAWFFLYFIHEYIPFWFPTGSKMLPVHIIIKQIRSHLLSALCRSTQFATYITTVLDEKCSVRWSAECEHCRRTYLTKDLR